MGTRSSQQTLVARSEALRGAADSVQQNEPSNQPNAGKKIACSAWQLHLQADGVQVHAPHGMWGMFF